MNKNLKAKANGRENTRKAKFFVVANFKNYLCKTLITSQ